VPQGEGVDFGSFVPIGLMVSVAYFVTEMYSTRAHTHIHTHNPFTALWILSGTTRVSRYRKKHSPTRTLRGHQISLSASSIYYDLWHPPYSIHVLYSLFPQSLSKFSLVYLLAWHPPLRTPYISSPNHYLLFTEHAHTIATCFAVVPRLCHLILVSLSTLYLGLYLVASCVREKLIIFLYGQYIVGMCVSLTFRRLLKFEVNAGGV